MTYQATRVAAGFNLEAFKNEIARSLGRDNLLQGLGDWLGVLMRGDNQDGFGRQSGWMMSGQAGGWA